MAPFFPEWICRHVGKVEVFHSVMVWPFEVMYCLIQCDTPHWISMMDFKCNFFFLFFFADVRYVAVAKSTPELVNPYTESPQCGRKASKRSDGGIVFVFLQYFYVIFFLFYFLNKHLKTMHAVACGLFLLCYLFE